MRACGVFVQKRTVATNEYSATAGARLRAASALRLASVVHSSVHTVHVELEIPARRPR